MNSSLTANDAFRAVTRYWDRITSPTQILTSLPQMLNTLLDPSSCGPAFLGLPQDVQVIKYDFPEEFFKPRTHKIPRPRPDLREIEQAIDLINKSEKPLIIAGGGVHYSLAESVLSQFRSREESPCR